jgi:hypothetical protein
LSTVVNSGLDCGQVTQRHKADSKRRIAVEEMADGDNAPKETYKAGSRKISQCDSKVVVGSSPSNENIISWFLV